MLVVALFTVLVTAEAVSSGLTIAEIAQFKPLDPDRIEQNTGLMGEVSITGNSLQLKAEAKSLHY